MADSDLNPTEIINMQPIRLTLAQLICRPLPPIMAQRSREFIYPRKVASEDDWLFSNQSRTGGILVHRTSDYHAYPFSVHGYDNWRHLAIAVAICSPGETVIEIGANVGTETIGFADIVGADGQVIAFEPLPQNVAVLQKLMELNNYSQVTLYPWAVGSETCQLSFAVPKDPSLSGSGHLAHASEANIVEQIEVTCTSLDDLEIEDTSVSAIFMDAEGSEELILQGGTGLIEECQPVIVLEASSNLLARLDCSTESLYRTIESFGYDIYRIGFLEVHQISAEGHKRKANWLALPREKQDYLNSINEMIKRCGLFPFVLDINPLMKV